MHVSQKPTVTYGSSTHNNQLSSYAFGDYSDINQYTGDFDVRVDSFDHNDEIWN